MEEALGVEVLLAKSPARSRKLCGETPTFRRAWVCC